ncbi:MAG TPA: HAMP domain-containing sensor histidine kinase [Candidatus Acidoferrum sp.]|nr:HAMP domain-containing sensor histidine kinase [Candidatus Acidoferrum sp.]
MKLQLLTWCIVGCICLGLVSSAFAVRRLDLSFQDDPRYLPYAFAPFYLAKDGPQRRWLTRAVEVLHVSHGPRDTAWLVFAHNPELTEDMTAQVYFAKLPQLETVSDNGLCLTLTDLYVVSDSKESRKAAVVLGYRSDSLFLMKLFPKPERRDSLYICSGKDATGDGFWRPKAYFIDTMDYDYDGRAELLFFVNTERDIGPRLLVCVDPTDMRIRWRRAVAAPVGSNALFDCRDRTSPGVIFVTQSPGNGIVDSVYDDHNSYLSRIDSSGKVVFARIMATNFQNAGLIRGWREGEFLVTHQIPLDTQATTGPPPDYCMYLSCIDGLGRVLESSKDTIPFVDCWLSDRNDEGTRDLYVAQKYGVVRILNQKLQVTAEGRSCCGIGFMRSLSSWENVGRAMALSVQGTTGAYNSDLKELARTESPYLDIIPVEYDSTGRLLTVLARGVNRAMVAHIERRGLWAFVRIAYLDYQYYILAVLFSLLVGFVVMNYYRSRTRRNLVLISQQKNELEKVHRALKEAQKTIIAQEKYRQAKDIAGGFAHEIRNALFPAEGALGRLATSQGPAAFSPEWVNKYGLKAKEAVGRALQLTRLISQYTKLESEYAPEAVCIASVVEDALNADGALIEQRGIAVRVSGEPGVAVECNRRQFYIVVNNLLLNGIDALADRPHPAITIEWHSDGSMIEFSLADNGCGIEEASQPRVFDTFYSTKPNTGTGLGLSMVKTIVELYGGSISLTSRVGEGTNVCAYLRIAGTNPHGE